MRTTITLALLLTTFVGTAHATEEPPPDRKWCWQLHELYDGTHPQWPHGASNPYPTAEKWFDENMCSQDFQRFWEARNHYLIATGVDPQEHPACNLLPWVSWRNHDLISRSCPQNDPDFNLCSDDWLGGVAISYEGTCPGDPIPNVEGAYPRLLDKRVQHMYLHFFRACTGAGSYDRFHTGPEWAGVDWVEEQCP